MSDGIDQVESSVDRTISPTDAMFMPGGEAHYFACGQSALRAIEGAISVGNVGTPKRILDYGAGAGRVTRWLRAAFPGTEIHACDLREQDMEFLRSHMAVDAWAVTADVGQAMLRGPYDVIWAGSVVTHLPAERTFELAQRLISACTPKGLLVMSFHGRHATGRPTNYIHDEAWAEILRGYRLSGYGYADYRGQSGYGISVFSADWAFRLAREVGCRVVMLSERGWDQHHDVIALQR